MYCSRPAHLLALAHALVLPSTHSPVASQAVPLESKKAAHVGKSAESPAALLQLPHFDKETLRRLTRKKVKALPGEQDGGGAR